MASFLNSGWVWEGQGFDPGVPPSIYGVGEGATYFGLDRCILIFHPTNAITLGKLRDKAEVVVDISKWKWIEVPRGDGPGGVGFRNWRDSNPATTLEEAEILSRLSLDFPNVTGAFIDDTTSMFGYEGYAADTPARIRAALHSANPNLKLWIVVYWQQLQEDYWAPFLDYVDVISLWQGHPEKLPELAQAVDRCHAVFPGKAISVGSYLHNYGKQEPVPLDMMARQYEIMYELWEAGRIEGFNILANCLIDRDPEQAEYIRGFLAEH